jgi:hypothetical protein
MPYWIAETLAGTPAFLWSWLGVGLPWALVLLPRRDWRFRVVVAVLALVAGTALLTVWMFLLGTFSSPPSGLLRFDWVFAGTVVLALVGAVLAWRKARGSPSDVEVGQTDRRGGARSAPTQKPRLFFDERLLLVLVAAALLVRWVVIAYWPFTAYDALWVYGYEGRLYTALGHIPSTIGYYPQYLPLQYSYLQLAFGGISDHAARAGLPFLHLGTILAVYVLGERLLNRRVGIIAAALWALYPHVGEWARAGDLEILLALLFTLAAAFFLLAWLGREPRRHYALLSGLILGVGLWTKPTMGAFVWGMGVLVAIELVRTRFNFRLAWNRLQLAILTLIAAAPLGGVWYVRNVLLGHAPIDLPPSFWLTQAARSGAEFGWPLLALLVYLAYVHFGSLRPRPARRLTLPGLALVLLGLLPSILAPHRMGLAEWLALGAGSALLGAALYRHARLAWNAEVRRAAAAVGYGLALALPYFVTWFYSYSYHPRLSFAIVPLLMLPTAVVLGHWLSPERMRRWRRIGRLAYALVLVALALPGVAAGIYDLNAGWDYLWTNALPDDSARYRSGNAALMNVVDGLQAYIHQHPGERLSVVAPGVERLPFFFPTHDIRVDDVPIDFEQLGNARYFVYGVPETRGAYQDVPLLENQVVGALGRADIMRRAWGLDDGFFRYDVYELNLQNRFVPPNPNGRALDDVVIGGFVRYVGYDIGGLELWPGRRLVLHLFWQALAPPPEDYTVFIHLRDANDQVITAWDGPVARTDDGWYSTLVWDVGEYIIDERTLMLPDGTAPEGEGYRIVIGMYNPVTNERVPMLVNGEDSPTGYTIGNRIAIVPAPPP